MTVDFSTVTELSGDDVTQEQVDRICHRYFWAGTYCRDKDVIEVACGTGQGLGLLMSVARSVRAGDFDQGICRAAQETYGERIAIDRVDAQKMPYADDSADVIILFEAIYYLPSAQTFAAECRRVLRENGKVLIATANKDLYDFNPSPYSHSYYGVVELVDLFASEGFDATCFGAWAIESVSFRQRALRGVKTVAVKLGLFPKTTRGKKWLKRLVFGKLVEMPAEIREGMTQYDQPTPLGSSEPDRKYKVIYCVATRSHE